MKTRRLLIICLCYVAACPVAGAGLPNAFEVLCINAFTDMYPGLNMDESELLASFSPARVARSRITFLDQSREHVILLTDNRGVQYIIRIGVMGQDIPLETFASHFYRAMGVPTPKIRKLNKEERIAMGPLLERAKVEGVTTPRKYPKNPEISVAVRHPAVMGYDHLIERNALGPIREIIMRMERDQKYGDSLGARRQRRADLETAEALREATDQRKEDFHALYADLRIIDPKFGDEWRGTEEHKIRSFIIYGEGQILRGISEVSESRIPPGTIERLCDAWVLSYVLGMGDMNHSNWMMYQGISFPIDVALANSGFREGTLMLPTEDVWLRFPLPDPTYADDPRVYFARHMSQALRERLSTLTASEIASIARESGIRANASQVEGVLARSSSLLAL